MFLKHRLLQRGDLSVYTIVAAAFRARMDLLTTLQAGVERFSFKAPPASNVFEVVISPDGPTSWPTWYLPGWR